MRASSASARVGVALLALALSCALFGRFLGFDTSKGGSPITSAPHEALQNFGFR